MRSKTKFLEHAPHPKLVIFPLGLLASGVISFITSDPIFVSKQRVPSRVE